MDLGLASASRATFVARDLYHTANFPATGKFWLAGAFGYITSSGSPDAVMGAKSTITAALTGLAVIIFSVLILGLLGVNVFGLPGFSWSPGNVLTTPQ